ncbi:hypothetical protein [Geopseudomonas aromaticivorans]
MRPWHFHLGAAGILLLCGIGAGFEYPPLAVFFLLGAVVAAVHAKAAKSELMA